MGRFRKKLTHSQPQVSSFSDKRKKKHLKVAKCEPALNTHSRIRRSGGRGGDDDEKESKLKGRNTCHAPVRKGSRPGRSLYWRNFPKHTRRVKDTRRPWRGGTKSRNIGRPQPLHRRRRARNIVKCSHLREQSSRLESHSGLLLGVVETRKFSSGTCTSRVVLLG